MARSRSDAPPKPLRSRGYGKLIGLTLLAMLVGCGLMAWEIFVDFDGNVSATRAPAVKVPSEPLPPATAAPPANNP